MVFKNVCLLVLQTKVALALEGLRVPPKIIACNYDTFTINLKLEFFFNIFDGELLVVFLLMFDLHIFSQRCF